MRWPWQTEKRNSVYSDAIISALLSSASGTTKGNPSALCRPRNREWAVEQIVIHCTS